MMSEVTPVAKFAVGDDVYVREPNRWCHGRDDYQSITGPVKAVEQIDGEFVYTVEGNGIYGGPIGQPFYMDDITLRLSGADIGHRLGTPLSQLSGRPGHPGYEEFKRIALSWGYE